MCTHCYKYIEGGGGELMNVKLFILDLISCMLASYIALKPLVLGERNLPKEAEESLVGE